MHMTRVIHGVFTPKEKTKSNPLLDKVGVFTSRRLAASKRGSKMNTDYQSAS